jgi:protein phosphatase
VLVAGAIGTYSWALGHWFVSAEGSGDDESVGVFRGLNVSVVGFDLYELHEDTGLPLSDLTQAARNRVRHGITADDQADADRILDRLRDQRLPLCRTAGSTPSTASPTPTAAPPATGAPAPEAPAPEVPAPDGSSTAPTTSSRTTASPEPGVDCREAG